MTIIRSASVLNRPTADCGLPIELWQDIFTLAWSSSIEEYDQDPSSWFWVDIPAKLMGVCKLWRVYAEMTPRIWTFIQLWHQPVSFMSSRCEQHLSHAGTLPLRVGVEYSPVNSFNLRRVLVKIPIHRVLEVSYRLQNEAGVAQTSMAYNTDLTDVTTLSYYGDNNEDMQYLISNIYVTLPKLHTLNLYGVVFSFLNNIETLRKLRWKTALPMHFPLIRTLTSLTVIHLTDMALIGDPSIRISMTQLQHLILEGITSLTILTHFIFNPLPNFETLSLLNIVNSLDTFYSLSAFLRHVSHSLKTLELDNPPFVGVASNPWRSAFQDTSSLRTLNIRDAGPMSMDVLNSLHETSHHLPDLNQILLSCQERNQVDSEIFLDFLNKRMLVLGRPNNIELTVTRGTFSVEQAGQLEKLVSLYFID